MNGDTNYRGFWRATVICCVLCIILFWIPVAITVVYYYWSK